MTALAATITYMTTYTRRELVGIIVGEEIARRGLSVREAARLVRIGPATINRIKAGDATVSDISLRSVEGGFGWPLRFLSYVLNGDTERIERLPDLRDDLRQFTLDALSDNDNPSTNHNSN